MDKFNIITNNKNWIENTAIEQLKTVANYKGVISAVGLPDLHAGFTPIGIAIVTEGYIYPSLIGGDIGCGMGLFDTGIDLKKFKMNKWESRLNYIRELKDIETENPFDEESPILDLGTIGSGNHFAEFQKVEKIYNQTEFDTLNIEKNDIQVLIHSGSRGYGQQILNQFKRDVGFKSDSEDAIEYMKWHDHALLWAERNRKIVANKLISWLGYRSTATKAIDCTHNYLQKYENTFIHRKGATSAINGNVVIPGSRGTLTYIVKPIGDPEKSAFSLSHGAGRKWARSICKSRIINKYDRDSIRRTDLKSAVVCHDTELLFQEAPEAYKNIERIIDILVENGLIEVVATLRPLITYKG